MGFDQDTPDEITYPNHLREIGPIFEINPKKELEIMANKYRIQAEESLNKFNRTPNSARVSNSGPIKLTQSMNKLISTSATQLNSFK